MFRSSKFIVSIVALLSFFISVNAITYDTPIINKFGQVGLFRTYSAKTLGMGRLAIGIAGNVSNDKKFVDAFYHYSAAGTLIDTLGNQNMVVSDMAFSLGYGITRYIDLSVMLPLFVGHLDYMKFPDNTQYGQDNYAGLGDLEISLKWQYPPYPHRKFFEMAYHGAVSVPTGERSDEKYFPRHAYYQMKNDTNRIKYNYSSGNIELDMKMLWTFDFDQLRKGAPVELHVNYGVRWTPYYLDNLFLLNAGLSYRPVNWITIFTEFSGETRIANLDRGFKLGDDPLRVSPGISITPPGGFFLTLGADISVASTNTSADQIYKSKEFANGEYILTRTDIEPKWRFTGNIGWAGFVLPQDNDKDGIKDGDDRCPKVAEDYDGFEDGDGCPEVDNDGDGIVDSLDKCPNDPEDLDGFEDEDGCPEFDNDGDGIQDTEDKCPLQKEDADGFEDEDGCPEIDNDGDGIVDSLDHCINKAEDKDGYEDQDGCPDTDNDMDGVPDSTDKCPNKPETFNAYEDEDGCPDEKPIEAPVKPKVKEIKRGRVILRGVNFESGKAILTGDSYVLLDQVYASLKEWPEVRLEIKGHTDSVGNARNNKRLSYNRAKSVRDYLVNQGIAPERLTAIGMGEEEPIAENTTADGRAQNRRVEMHRVD